MTPKIQEIEIKINDIIHELEAFDFNSEGARKVVRRVLNQTHQETLEEIGKEIKEQTIPAIARDEEVECCNCGEDLALESYEWMGEGYDILNIIQSKKENI